LATWCSFVERVERGYSDSIYEYTNDLSSRDLLEELLAKAPESAKAKLTRFIHPSWWFGVPRIVGGELEADLHSQGNY